MTILLVLALRVVVGFGEFSRFYWEMYVLSVWHVVDDIAVYTQPVPVNRLSITVKHQSRCLLALLQPDWPHSQVQNKKLGILPLLCPGAAPIPTPSIKTSVCSQCKWQALSQPTTHRRTTIHFAATTPIALTRPQVAFECSLKVAQSACIVAQSFICLVVVSTVHKRIVACGPC